MKKLFFIFTILIPILSYSQYVNDYSKIWTMKKEYDYHHSYVGLSSFQKSDNLAFGGTIRSTESENFTKMQNSIGSKILLSIGKYVFLKRTSFTIKFNLT